MNIQAGKGGGVGKRRIGRLEVRVGVSVKKDRRRDLMIVSIMVSAIVPTPKQGSAPPVVWSK